MQKIKSLLGEFKNPKINQDVESLLTEVKIIKKKLQLDQETIHKIQIENDKLGAELVMICKRLDETSSNITSFIAKSEDTKLASVAIISWTIFFVAVAGAVYAIANSI
tara:strand:+ start:1401 stop:1724 length:324 start_codon:yes stop_codon:yes gene_type:complete